MSRAFVNEDAGEEQEASFSLPDVDSPYYDEAAAWALIQGADQLARRFIRASAAL